MAELVGGVNDPVRGKVGNVVFYMRNGKAFVRSRPRKRGKKRTVKGKINTTGFAKVQKWMKPIGEFIRYGFKDYGTSEVPYRSAVSYALNNAIEGTYPNQFIDPSLVRVTGGDLLMPQSASFVLEEGGIVRFNWDKGDVSSMSSQDQAMLLVYSPDTDGKDEKAFQFKVKGAFRREGTDILPILPARYDQEFHVYLGFVNADRTQQSHSMYLGSIFLPGMEQEELFESYKLSHKIIPAKIKDSLISARDKTLDIAKNLRNIGLSDADIAATTGLSLEDLENLPAE